MAFVIYSDEQHKIWYKEETTFGTPTALDGSAYKGIEFEKGQFFDPGVTKTNLNLNRSSRVLSLVDMLLDTHGGPVGYSFSTLLSKDRAADLVYLVTQNRVSQGLVGTGYSKVFRMHASQPDFTANAGCFVTMIWDSPISAKDVVLTSGILRDLTLTWDKSGSGETNLVKATGNFIFKECSINQTSTATGTARDVSLAYKAQDFSMDITPLGGKITAVPWSRFSLTLSNNAVGVDRDSNGRPVTFFLNPGDSCKASAELWYTGGAAALLSDYAIATNVLVELTKGTADTDGYFKIAAYGQITNVPISAGDGQMRVPIELQLGNTTAAGTNACDITIADAISQT